ncbi:MAG TPA: hypothetical protein G4N98_08055 [Thermoflexia bacterium]|nr:hypothetical protein [Thermoflexia bacterium]
MRAKFFSLFCLLIVLCSLSNAHSGWAAPTSQQNWNIISPVEGSVVSGETAITGTASHDNFHAYGVLYAPGPHPTADSQWVPIVFGVQNMVVNGPLATWDTKKIPNGQYTLALAVYEVGNDTPNLYFVNELTVENADETPTPTPTASPTVDAAAEPTAVPDEEAIIAPTIAQPPTATPRPTPTLNPAGGEREEGAVSEAENEEKAAALFPPEKMKEAFISGVWIAILLYVFGGIYVAGRAALRYYLKQEHQRTR